METDGSPRQPRTSAAFSIWCLPKHFSYAMVLEEVNLESLLSLDVPEFAHGTEKRLFFLMSMPEK